MAPELAKEVVAEGFGHPQITDDAGADPHRHRFHGRGGRDGDGAAALAQQPSGGLETEFQIRLSRVILSITLAISPWRRCRVLSMLDVRGLKITGCSGQASASSLISHRGTGAAPDAPESRAVRRTRSRAVVRVFDARHVCQRIGSPVTTALLLSRPKALRPRPYRARSSAVEAQQVGA